MKSEFYKKLDEALNHAYNEGYNNTKSREFDKWTNSVIEEMEAYRQEKVKGSADWKTIENNFKEWDAAGGFKASQRDILDWFKDNLPVGQEKEVVMPSDEEIATFMNAVDYDHFDSFWDAVKYGMELMRDITRDRLQLKPVD